MKRERPILFSAPMVKTLLDGSKTMTRRIMKPQPDENGVRFMPTPPSLDWEQYYKEHWKCFLWDTEEGERIHTDPPYGIVGDILWVRETWRPIEQDFGSPRYEYKATEKINLKENWRPSIFMPKEACRIRLEITDVRTERLQDISEEDAMNEGAERGILLDGPNTEKGEFQLEHNIHAHYKNGFKFIWMTINGKESWDANPWVWVISFKNL